MASKVGRRGTSEVDDLAVMCEFLRANEGEGGAKGSGKRNARQRRKGDERVHGDSAHGREDVGGLACTHQSKKAGRKALGSRRDGLGKRNGDSYLVAR